MSVVSFEHVHILMYKNIYKVEGMKINYKEYLKKQSRITTKISVINEANKLYPN